MRWWLIFFHCEVVVSFFLREIGSFMMPNFARVFNDKWTYTDAVTLKSLKQFQVCQWLKALWSQHPLPLLPLVVLKSLHLKTSLMYVSPVYPHFYIHPFFDIFFLLDLSFLFMLSMSFVTQFLWFSSFSSYFERKLNFRLSFFCAK